MGDNTHSDFGRLHLDEKALMTDSPTPQQDQVEEGLIRPEDIRSTSRSCLAIILITVAIFVLLCVFVVVQTWIR